MRVLVLGAPRATSDSWHDDLVEESIALGWDTRYERTMGKSTKDIVEMARGRDMVIWLHAHRHIPKGDARTMLRRIEDNGVVTVGLHLDLYWGIQRESRICRDDWWDCQYVYTADGGNRDWKRRGLVQHRWCPPALGARHLGRVAPRGRYRYVFIGSYVRSIHGDHRAKLLNWAKRTYRGEFYWYGHTPRDRVYGKRTSEVVAHADVTLGDAAPAPYYWSDRVVRQLGRGAVLAHPHVDGMIEQGFTNDTILYFNRYDFDGLKERIESMTENEREAQRDAAVTVVEERHLWRHRLAMFAREAGLV